MPPNAIEALQSGATDVPLYVCSDDREHGGGPPRLEGIRNRAQPVLRLPQAAPGRVQNEATERRPSLSRKGSEPGTSGAVADRKHGRCRASGPCSDPLLRGTRHPSSTA